MSEIKPCPFCGSSPFYYEDELSDDRLFHSYIECENQDCQVSIMSKQVMIHGEEGNQEKIEELISKWNRRV